MINYQQQNPYAFNAHAMPYMPSFTPSQPAQPVQPNNVSWIYVNGLEGARGQIVQPNQTAWMMDNSDPVIYVKSVDAVGTATLRGFRLTEISTTGAQPIQQPDMSGYVTREDITSITDRIKALEDFMGGLNT